jgi:hypothetical protein
MAIEKENINLTQNSESDAESSISDETNTFHMYYMDFLEASSIGNS